MDHFVLQSAVLTIFRKTVELCNILLCGFSPLLVAAVESCMFVYDVPSYFEENVEFFNDGVVFLLFFCSICRKRTDSVASPMQSRRVPTCCSLVEVVSPDAILYCSKHFFFHCGQTSGV